MRIVEDDLRRAEVRELLERHALGMQENSPQGACHYFDLDALQASDVTVWSIWGVQSHLPGSVPCGTWPVTRLGLRRVDNERRRVPGSEVNLDRDIFGEF